MQTLVLLPQLELTMENVRVVSLSTEIGRRVAADQPLMEVETGKAVQPVLAPKAGFVRQFLVQLNDEIREKTPLCILADTLEEPISAAAPSPVSPPQTDAPPRSREDEAATKAAPAARKLARDLNVSLSSVQGSGPHGRITVDDVKRAAAAGSSPSETWQSISPSRQALVAQMQKSLAEIPQFHVARWMDVAPLLAKKESTTFTARLAFCLGRVLALHPALRTVFAANKIRVSPISVAIAMDTPRGLVAPALRLTDLASLAAVAAALPRLREQAAAGSLPSEALADAPFAVSNLGMFGVDFFTPFVFHGQTAVLGVSRSVGGKAWFNLAVDHRVCDGAEAARFLQTLQQEILAL